jgi:hypothetical protein
MAFLLCGENAICFAWWLIITKACRVCYTCGFCSISWWGKCLCDWLSWSCVGFAICNPELVCQLWSGILNALKNPNREAVLLLQSNAVSPYIIFPVLPGGNSGHKCILQMVMLW